MISSKIVPPQRGFESEFSFQIGKKFHKVTAIDQRAIKVKQLMSWRLGEFVKEEAQEEPAEKKKKRPSAGRLFLVWLTKWTPDQWCQHADQGWRSRSARVDWWRGTKRCENGRQSAVSFSIQRIWGLAGYNKSDYQSVYESVLCRHVLGVGKPKLWKQASWNYCCWY